MTAKILFYRIATLTTKKHYSSASKIASFGHVFIQAKHSMHTSGSISYLPSSLSSIAPTGQIEEHRPQAIHVSLSITTIFLSPLPICTCNPRAKSSLGIAFWLYLPGLPGQVKSQLRKYLLGIIWIYSIISSPALSRFRNRNENINSKSKACILICQRSRRNFHILGATNTNPGWAPTKATGQQAMPVAPLAKPALLSGILKLIPEASPLNALQLTILPQPHRK